MGIRGLAIYARLCVGTVYGSVLRLAATGMQMQVTAVSIVSSLPGGLVRCLYANVLSVLRYAGTASFWATRSVMTATGGHTMAAVGLARSSADGHAKVENALRFVATGCGGEQKSAMTGM